MGPLAAGPVISAAAAAAAAAGGARAPPLTRQSRSEGDTGGRERRREEARKLVPDWGGGFQVVVWGESGLSGKRVLAGDRGGGSGLGGRGFWVGRVRRGERASSSSGRRWGCRPPRSE